MIKVRGTFVLQNRDKKLKLFYSLIVQNLFKLFISAYMIDYQINTDRLKLIPLTAEWIEEMKSGPAPFKALTGYGLPSPYTEFPEAVDQIIMHLESSQSLAPWISYGVIKKDESMYIGQGGFKGEPNEEGVVEIGYEIAKDYRGRGFAHEIIQYLVGVAFNHPEVKTIMAHTLAAKNESNHLLIKNKFVYDKTIIDPDDGAVWQWILKRSAYQLGTM